MRGAMEPTRAEFRQQGLNAYAQAIEQHAWDGEWYRRAYFDDGTPLGSASSDECTIDSIAQSWGVISGAAPLAMQHVRWRPLNRYLVRSDARLIALLTPPFDHTTARSGLHQRVSTRVRGERRAVTRHGALWAVWATALQGDGDRRPSSIR